VADSPGAKLAGSCIDICVLPVPEVSLTITKSVLVTVGGPPAPGQLSTGPPPRTAIAPPGSTARIAWSLSALIVTVTRSEVS
jgi:hypothetical protein